MITEKNKASRIIKEIINYYLDNQIYLFDIHVNITPETITITITAQCQTIPATFTQLLADLNVTREVEMDEYYNALLGSHNHHEDYTFLGKSIDSAIGSYEDNLLSLTLIRHHIH